MPNTCTPSANGPRGSGQRLVVVGAGPAGLTAGYEATRFGLETVVLEKSSDVGGLAQTAEYKGFHFDMGGHRLFTKAAPVEKMWREVLGPKLLRRPRLSRIYYRGPRQPARTRLYRMIRQGRMPVLGKGDALWSMSYVDNTCQALLLAEGSEVAAGKTYWVADRRPYTVREIADTVETLLEREFEIPVRHRRRRLPVVAGRVAAAADVLLQRFGVIEKRLHALGHLQESGACSIAAARRDLGYDSKIELEEGTRRSIRWCLENGQEI